MDRIPHETSEQLSRALGEAVVRVWGYLPHDIQRELFEEAISFRGEGMRPDLAVYLHGKHPRTSASIIQRAMVEPDSLGG
jgi:hypothetical protein